MLRYAINPRSTALIVVDMNNDFIAEGAGAEIGAGRRMVPTLRRLADSCRAASVEVIYFTVAWNPDGSDMGRVADTFPSMVDSEGRPTVCIAGTEGVAIFGELAPKTGDVVFEKQRFSCFAGTDLDAFLRRRGIDTIIVTGVAANGCCESTARDAVNRDFKVIYVSDCNATIDLPDLGWGQVTADEVMRVLLTELAFSTGEVASAADIVERLSLAPQA